MLHDPACSLYVLTMSLTVGILMKVGATLHLHCVCCGRCCVYPGSANLRKLGIKELDIGELQRRARCKLCKGRAEVIITIPQTVIEDVRKYQVLHLPISSSNGQRLGKW